MVFKKIEPKLFQFEKEGDEIIGKLVKVENDIGKFKSIVYHMMTENQEQISFFGSTVLDNLLSYCKIGDKLKIIFTEKKPSDKGQDTKMFEVYKDDEQVPEDSEEA